MEIVTATSVSEVGFLAIQGIELALVSFVPSEWDFTPVNVVLRTDNKNYPDIDVELQNWRAVNDARDYLDNTKPEIHSWAGLRHSCAARCGRLVFADEAFKSLDDIPFAMSSAKRISILLDVLNRRASAFNSSGSPTIEAHRIDSDYFKGQNSLFSDSSETEKQEFRSRFTFKHPTDPTKSLWCPWHAKERHLSLRIHFSWPIRPNEPVYVVYVGSKLTRR